MEIEEQSGNFGVAFEFPDFSRSFWIRFLRDPNPSSSGYAVYVRRVQSQSTAVVAAMTDIIGLSKFLAYLNVFALDTLTDETVPC